MSIKRNMVLAAPIARDAFSDITGFALDYFYVQDNHLAVYLQPSGSPVVSVYPNTAVDVVPSKGVIVLTAAQTLKLSNFISAIEDACKISLETP